MSTPYAGTDVYPDDILVPDDGDARDGASVATGDQGLADRTTWIKNRFFDKTVGGSINGNVQFNNFVAFVQNVSMFSDLEVQGSLEVTNTITAAGYSLNPASSREYWIPIVPAKSSTNVAFEPFWTLWTSGIYEGGWKNWLITGGPGVLTIDLDFPIYHTITKIEAYYRGSVGVAGHLALPSAGNLPKLVLKRRNVVGQQVNVLATTIDPSINAAALDTLHVITINGSFVQSPSYRHFLTFQADNPADANATVNGTLSGIKVTYSLGAL